MTYKARSEKIEGRQSAYNLTYGKGSKKLTATIHLANGLEGYTSAQWLLRIEGLPDLLKPKKSDCIKAFQEWAEREYDGAASEAAIVEPEVDNDPLPDLEAAAPVSDVPEEGDDLTNAERGFLMALGKSRGRISMINRLYLLQLADRFRPGVERHQAALMPAKKGPPAFKAVQ